MVERIEGGAKQAGAGASEPSGTGLAFLVTLCEQPQEGRLLTIDRDPEPGWLVLGIRGDAAEAPVRVHGLQLIDALEELLDD